MKTGLLHAEKSSAIVQWADTHAELSGHMGQILQRARAFAEPLLDHQQFDTGENALAHANGVCTILASMGAAPTMQAAAYLVYASQYLSEPQEVISRAFSEDLGQLVASTGKLVQVQRTAFDAIAQLDDGPLLPQQIERIRKMMLAFSRDLRVVLLRLASRLQTLRHYALTNTECPRSLARESLLVFSTLANRLGIWQIKWEMEDLSFRFLEPKAYRHIAQQLQATRLAREKRIQEICQHLHEYLTQSGIHAQVQGRPKHFYSIWKKMQAKNLNFEQLFDLQALRVIVADVPTCYNALSLIHELWPAINSEYSDYIAKPKFNGYQSLHTVVVDEQGLHIEIQIRTPDMHNHAESGVAAHWVYKEASNRGPASKQSVGDFETRIAQARKTVLHQLLAWERDLADGDAHLDDRIYVFTPETTVIDLPMGGTPIDFAYTLHTSLGHRCRGARVDGALVPLNTALASGQTVEIITAKEGGPSRDWLNPELGYIQSHRARAKVRAWFNGLAQQSTIAKGRELVEKLLQRLGKTAIKLEDIAALLGFKSAADLFELVGKDEFSLHQVETVLKPAEPAPDVDQIIIQKINRIEQPLHALAGQGVLVVGVDSLMTQLARCCKPAPGDAIGGYVTRGKGVAVHRTDCSNFHHMSQKQPERIIAVTWRKSAVANKAVYPVDICVEGVDRPSLLRDVCEVFAQAKIHVLAMRNQITKELITVMLTIEVTDTRKLAPVVAKVLQVKGVLRAKRR